MSDIAHEMEEMADKMEKSVKSREFGVELIKSTVLKLGPEGLKKAAANLNEKQKELLLEVLEDMKKSAGKTLEPKSDSTPAGDEKYNEEKEHQTEHDEELAEEAKKRKMMEHRNQGGSGEDGAWEGQVVKSAGPIKDFVAEEAKEKEHSPKAIKELKQFDKEEGEEDEHKVEKSKEENKECEKEDKEVKKLPMMKSEDEKKDVEKCSDGMKLEKKQGVPEGADPATHERCVKDVKAEGHDKSSAFAICNASGAGMKKADDAAPEAPDMEKGGSGSGRKPMAPGLAGVESVKNLKAREEEGKKIQEKFEQKEPAMSLEDKKKVAKGNLKKMMERMQERKMEKAQCIAVLAKSLEVSEEKLGQVWDALAKSDVLPEKGNPEGNQSSVPSQMKGEPSAGVHDPEDPSVPKYKDKSAKKVEKEEPAGGKAHQLADEGEQPPKPLKKSDSYFYEEEEVYLAKSGNPFAVRSIKPNAVYNVDEFIEAEMLSKKDRLSKSTFDYDNEGEALEKGYMGFKKLEHKIEGEGKSKESADAIAAAVGRKKYGKGEFQHAAAEGHKMNKSDDPTEADVVEANAKKKADAKKEDAQEVRQIKTDEKLSRIEGKEGPKMPFVKSLQKSWAEEFIVKSLDMDMDQAEVAQANRTAEASGSFLVKSFSDEEMESLFNEKDMWGDSLEKAKKKEVLKKDGTDTPPTPPPSTAGQGTTNLDPQKAAVVSNYFKNL